MYKNVEAYLTNYKQFNISKMEQIFYMTLFTHYVVSIFT